MRKIGAATLALAAFLAAQTLVIRDQRSAQLFAAIATGSSGLVMLAFAEVVRRTGRR